MHQQSNIQYVDIDSYQQFHQLPTTEGKYWCEFYGGNKNYRCFLVDKTFHRATLLADNRYLDLLDVSILPIFESPSFSVRQDPSHPMPGFYIVAPKHVFHATDQLSLTNYLTMRFLDYAISDLLVAHKVKTVAKVNEERQVSYQNVLTWVLPMDLASGESIKSINTLDYMIRFGRWRETQEQIVELNANLRKRILAQDLRSKTHQFECIIHQLLQNSELLNSLESLISASTQHSELDTTITCEQPLYQHMGISIYHSVSWLPGHYHITHRPNPELAENRLCTYIRMRLLEFVIRVAMRHITAIQHAYKVHEQDLDSQLVGTIEIIPIYDINKHNRIYNFRISDYISRYGGQFEDALKIHRKLHQVVSKLPLEIIDKQVLSACSSI